MSDESQLRRLLSDAVPEPPTVPERADRARQVARSSRHRRSMIAVGGAIAIVAAVGLPAVLGSSDGGPAPSPSPATETGSSDAIIPGDFTCPRPWVVESPAPANPAESGPSELPGAAIAARLCEGSSYLTPGLPRDALTMGVDALVRVINDLPVQPPCPAIPADLGATMGIAFQYADGHVQVVQVEQHGCGGVMVGGQVRGDRSNAWRPIHRFADLLLSQRSALEPPDVSVPLDCRDPSSAIVKTEPPLVFTRAVLCWRHQTEGESPTMSAEIAAADLKTLMADLNAHTTNVEITEEECREQLVALTIVGQNTWGDRIVLYGDCGPFNLTQNNAKIWRPDERSQSILDRLVASQPLEFPDLNASMRPQRVVELWADLFNAGQIRRADALWSQSAPHPDGRVEVKIEGVRDLERPAYMSAPTELREVSALYRVVPADGSYADYHDYKFTLTRLNDSEPWTIVSLEDRGEVPTGR